MSFWIFSNISSYYIKKMFSNLNIFMSWICEQKYQGQNNKYLQKAAFHVFVKAQTWKPCNLKIKTETESFPEICFENGVTRSFELETQRTFAAFRKCDSAEWNEPILETFLQTLKNFWSTLIWLNSSLRPNKVGMDILRFWLETAACRKPGK